MELTKIQKEEIRVSLFTGEMFVSLGILKVFTKNLFELINKFNKFAWYKITVCIG